MLDCISLQSALKGYDSCLRTADGLMVHTQCMYPSFEQVDVYVVSFGDGYIVHDGGGAARNAWLYNCDQKSVSQALKHAANSYGCSAKDLQLCVEVPSVDWLWSGVVAVANASADAARYLAAKVRNNAVIGVIQKTKIILDSASWKPETKLQASYPGQSGKVHIFDLSVRQGDSLALIDAVNSHPASIASKYLAFSDTERRSKLFKYALYEEDLAQEDKVLLSNVADLIAFKAISGTDGKFLIQ